MTCQHISGAIVCARERPRRGLGRINENPRAGLPGAGLQERVEHVRRSTQTRVHLCHWPGCKRQVPPATWGCKEHWFKLPPNLRARIWNTYRIGQEEDGRPSAAYLAVAREAQEWIKRRAERGSRPGRQLELEL